MLEAFWSVHPLLSGGGLRGRYGARRLMWEKIRRRGSTRSEISDKKKNNNKRINNASTLLGLQKAVGWGWQRWGSGWGFIKIDGATFEKWRKF